MKRLKSSYGTTILIFFLALASCDNSENEFDLNDFEIEIYNYKGVEYQLFYKQDVEVSYLENEAYQKLMPILSLNETEILYKSDDLSNTGFVFDNLMELEIYLGYSLDTISSLESDFSGRTKIVTCNIFDEMGPTFINGYTGTNLSGSVILLFQLSSSFCTVSSTGIFTSIGGYTMNPFLPFYQNIESLNMFDAHPNANMAVMFRKAAGAGVTYFLAAGTPKFIPDLGTHKNTFTGVSIVISGTVQ